MPSRPAATIAVLNYDGRDVMEMCLPSVFAQDLAGYEVVVVDNGSRDGSVEYLAERWPEARVVALPDNVGVTRALNVCVEAADAEYVALINNDVELTPGWLRELVDTLAADPGAGSASGKLLSFHERHVLDGTGDQIHWSTVAVRRGQGEVDQGQYDSEREVPFASAAAGLFRTEAFQDVGLLDEQFFCWFEDVDWGLRAQLAGWRSLYNPNAVAYHIGAATLGSEPTPFSRFQHRRNSIWLALKGFPASSLLRHSPELLKYQAWMLFESVRDGWGRTLLAAWWGALRGMPSILRKRRAIQRRRRVSTGYVERLVKPHPAAATVESRPSPPERA